MEQTEDLQQLDLLMARIEFLNPVRLKKKVVQPGNCESFLFVLFG